MVIKVVHCAQKAFPTFCCGNPHFTVHPNTQSNLIFWEVTIGMANDAKILPWKIDHGLSDPIDAKRKIASRVDKTSAYLLSMSKRFTACEIGERS